MIEKRINYRFGGGYQGGAPGNTGQSRGGGGRDAGMGMAGKSRGPSRDVSAGVGRGGEGTLADPREKMDFFGKTAFGPAQKYSGDGFFSGYRNLDRRGQPLMGMAYLGDRLKSFASGLNPLSLIGGLVAGPVGSFIGRGISSLGALRDYDTLADYAKGEFGLFSDEDEEDVETQDIRDKFNRMGIMNPNLITPQPKPGINLNDYMGLEDRFNVPSAAPEDYDFTGFEDVMAFNPGSIKDRALKQQFNIYNATGIVTPNMQKLMQEDMEQHQKKGTPLSLPAEAYRLV